MATVVESVSTNSFTAASSITITKPSGLASGDLMVALLSIVGGGTISDTSGWTTVSNYTDVGVGIDMEIQYKIANSTDVAASNFTFSGTLSNRIIGALYRISGYATDQIGSFVEGGFDGNDKTNFSIPVSLSPLTSDSAVVAHMVTRGGNVTSGTYSFTGYGTDQSIDFTADINAFANYGTTDPIYIAMHGTHTSSSQINSLVGTVDKTSNACYGQIMLITPLKNASGSSSFILNDSSVFEQHAISSVSGSNALQTVNSIKQTTSGLSITPTPWTTVTKS